MTDEKAAIVTGGSYAIGGEESTVALTKEVAKFVATARRVNECEETEHLAQIRF
jgi:NADP-dependent 3-hydroxy acid dehydrogenase YdfG